MLMFKKIYSVCFRTYYQEIILIILPLQPYVNYPGSTVDTDNAAGETGNSAPSTDDAGNEAGSIESVGNPAPGCAALLLEMLV